MAKQHNNQDPLAQRIAELFPVGGFEYSFQEIADLLDYRSREDKIDLSLALQKLLKAKTIQEFSNGKFGLPDPASQKANTGKVDFINPRYAYIRMEGETQTKDVFVPVEDLKGAQDGDLVEIAIFAGRKSKNPEGQVLNIIQRARHHYVGTLRVKSGIGWLSADYRKMHEEILINEGHLKGARDGQKVQVEIKHWGTANRKPQGVVSEVLGLPGENNAEMHAILADYNIPLRFSAESEREVAEFSGVISEEETKDRRDFRNVLTFTIDPFDAKDFDDAISIEPAGDGIWEVGVHIADVSHFVKPGTVLDKEAFDRATSVYLVDRVSPMLPERLSNDLCSLRPNEDRLTFSCVVFMDAQGKMVKKPWIGRTVIHSKRRYTYEEVQEVIEGNPDPNQDYLRLLNEMALAMRDGRMSSGAMSFESTEVKFLLDDNGIPLKVIPKIRKDAHKLVEEFMLLANRTVAEYAFFYNDGKATNPMVYRVHESPNPERLQNFADFASRFGYKINVSDEKVALSLNAMVAKLEGTPEQELMQNLAIRVMAKARYTTKALGHFGLAFQHYSHFTSPIRRYPDVLTHRLLWNYLQSETRMEKDALEKLCIHCSDKEKMASEAERASIKYKQVEYMALQDSSKIYDGVVSGVTEWGIFVEITENRCEGMVRITDLNIDTFDHLEKEYCLVGRRTKLRITFGDKVKVRVKAANIEKRNIDFVLEELAGGKVQPKEDRSIYQKPVWTKGRKSSSKGGGRKRR
jgi:ribonuclease R